MTADTAFAAPYAGQKADFDFADGAKAFPAIYEPRDFDGRASYSAGIPLSMIDPEMASIFRAYRGETVHANSGRAPRVTPELTAEQVDEIAAKLGHRIEPGAKMPLLSPGACLEFVTPTIDILVRELDRLAAQNLPRDHLFAGRRMIAHTTIAVKGINYEEDHRAAAGRSNYAKPAACLWLQGVTVYL